MPLPFRYGIDRLIESHEITIERDVAVVDAFGAEAKREWQPLGTFRAAFWWWQSRGKGAFKEEGSEERVINIAGGGALVHRDVDVQEKDRVSRIFHIGPGVEILGPFRITSVREHPTHKEISLQVP